MTLAELVAGYRRRAVEAEAVGATAPLAATYELIVSELVVLIPAGNLHAPTTGNGHAPDALLTPRDVAARLGVSLRFVYQHQDQLGGRALSRRALRFPSSAVDRYVARRP